MFIQIPIHHPLQHHVRIKKKNLRKMVIFTKFKYRYIKKITKLSLLKLYIVIIHCFAEIEFAKSDRIEVRSSDN